MFWTTHLVNQLQLLINPQPQQQQTQQPSVTYKKQWKYIIKKFEEENNPFIDKVYDDTDCKIVYNPYNTSTAYTVIDNETKKKKVIYRWKPFPK